MTDHGWRSLVHHYKGGDDSPLLEISLSPHKGGDEWPWLEVSRSSLQGGDNWPWLEISLSTLKSRFQRFQISEITDSRIRGLSTKNHNVCIVFNTFYWPPFDMIEFVSFFRAFYWPHLKKREKAWFFISPIRKSHHHSLPLSYYFILLSRLWYNLITLLRLYHNLQLPQILRNGNSENFLQKRKFLPSKSVFWPTIAFIDRNMHFQDWQKHWVHPFQNSAEPTQSIRPATG